MEGSSRAAVISDPAIPGKGGAAGGVVVRVLSEGCRQGGRESVLRSRLVDVGYVGVVLVK